MEEILEMLERIKWLSDHPYAILNVIFRDRDLQQKILNLIRWKQLYEKGIDGQGASLGEYSPYTITLKQAKGQRFDHITLSDTFKFYESFEFIISGGIDNDRFSVEVDPVKEDGTNLLTEFGEDIIAHTEENLEIIRDLVNEVFAPMVEEYIFKGGGTVIRSIAA